MDKLTSWRLGVTPTQMREVDRRAQADYGIQPLQLMEVAGLVTARVAREMIGPPGGRAVCILAGKGNNGGDGLVAARRLAGWGAHVTVLTPGSLPPPSGPAGAALESARRQEIPIKAWEGALHPADLYVDALLGFGAAGPPREAIAAMIGALSHRRVLALDLPSGLDAATGETPGACVVAEVTVTLGAPKQGMLSPLARRHVGELRVADIGIPRGLLREVGVDPSGLFEGSDIEVLRPG